MTEQGLRNKEKSFSLMGAPFYIIGFFPWCVGVATLVFLVFRGLGL